MSKLLQAPLLFVSAVASAAAGLGVARLWAWPLVFEPGPTGLGMRRIPLRSAQVWSATGALLAFGYLAVAAWVVPHHSGTPLGPLAAAAAAGGISRFTWALIAVIFAPIVEEFFFRGLMFTGFAARWGTTGAATAVTLIFVAMHLFEIVAYWPAIAFITVLGAGAAIARIKTGSLVAPVLLHLSYNTALVIFVYVSAFAA